MRPATGVIALTDEFIDARVVGLVCYKQRTDRADKKSCRVHGAVACLHPPPLTALIEKRIIHPGFERYVGAKIKAIRNMF